MHISEESEEEADAERKEANEPEAHEAPETDEKQEDEGNGENPEHSNEEQNCHVWEILDLTELILVFGPFIYIDIWMWERECFVTDSCQFHKNQTQPLQSFCPLFYQHQKFVFVLLFNIL